jgi:hypothetical protein
MTKEPNRKRDAPARDCRAGHREVATDSPEYRRQPEQHTGTDTHREAKRPVPHRRRGCATRGTCGGINDASTGGPQNAATLPMKHASCTALHISAASEKVQNWFGREDVHPTTAPCCRCAWAIGLANVLNSTRRRLSTRRRQPALSTVAAFFEACAPQRIGQRVISFVTGDLEERLVRVPHRELAAPWSAKDGRIVDCEPIRERGAVGH